MYILQLIDFPPRIADETLLRRLLSGYFIKSHIPRYSTLKWNWYCANVCGCRVTGWRDPTGFLAYLFVYEYYVDC